MGDENEKGPVPKLTGPYATFPGDVNALKFQLPECQWFPP